MHSTYKFSQHTKTILPIWLYGSMFVYNMSGCGFEFRCCHLDAISFAYHWACSFLASIGNLTLKVELIKKIVETWHYLVICMILNWVRNRYWRRVEISNDYRSTKNFPLNQPTLYKQAWNLILQYPYNVFLFDQNM